MARSQCDTPLVSNLLNKMCMQPEIWRQIFQKSCGKISACHMPDISSCSSRKPRTSTRSAAGLSRTPASFLKMLFPLLPRHRRSQCFFLSKTQDLLDGYQNFAEEAVTSNLNMPMVNDPGYEIILIGKLQGLVHWVLECRQRHSLRSDNVFGKTNLLQRVCLVIHYMERHGMRQTFANYNGDYGEKVRLEIETQQLTLNQDKQHEHNLNLTLQQRKTPSPKRSRRLMNWGVEPWSFLILPTVA